MGNYGSTKTQPEGFIPSGFFVAWIPIIAPETDKGYSVTGDQVRTG